MPQIRLRTLFIATAICAALVWVVLSLVVGRPRLPKAAKLEIIMLVNACKMYRLNVKIFPDALDDLHTVPAGMSQAEWGGPYLDRPVNKDPWRRPYVYYKDEANDRIVVTSIGPDGQSGTKDDISKELRGSSIDETL